MARVFRTTGPTFKTTRPTPPPKTRPAVAAFAGRGFDELLDLLHARTGDAFLVEHYRIAGRQATVQKLIALGVSPTAPAPGPPPRAPGSPRIGCASGAFLNLAALTGSSRPRGLVETQDSAPPEQRAREDADERERQRRISVVLGSPIFAGIFTHEDLAQLDPGLLAQLAEAAQRAAAPAAAEGPDAYESALLVRAARAQVAAGGAR